MKGMKEASKHTGGRGRRMKEGRKEGRKEASTQARKTEKKELGKEARKQEAGKEESEEGRKKRVPCGEGLGTSSNFMDPEDCLICPAN